MIVINGQLCYSPVAPSRYGRPLAGFPVSCRNDVQLWNLLYLTCEGIEDHRDPSTDADVGVLVNRDLNALATSLAALTGAACRELFPDLRDALKKHPSVFLQELWKVPWEYLPPAMQIPNWADIVTDKVATIHAQATLDLRAAIPSLRAAYDYVKS